MKFKLLSIGQNFEYEGETYVKTSPLIASNIKTGQNKMIPRYATLKLLDQSGNSEQQARKSSLAPEEILTAFNLFYEKCIAILEEKKVLVPQIKDEMDKARDEFTRHLF